jgi:drug/metabolite transporter (DMT)-like permease
MGAILMILASFLFAFASLCIKIILSYGKIPSFQIVFVRSIIIAVFVFCHQRISKVPHPLGPPEIRGLLMLRGFIGFVGMCLGFFGTTVLSIGDSTSLGFTAPVFTGIAAYFILKEPWEVHLLFLTKRHLMLLLLYSL